VLVGIILLLLSHRICHSLLCSGRLLLLSTRARPLAMILSALLAACGILILFWPITLWLLCLLSLLFLLRLYLRGRARRQQNGRFTLAFFHPFCNSGGGGERVLWQYVRTLQLADPTLGIIIYTGDQESGEEILKKAQSRFNLPPVPTSVTNPLEFVRLHHRRLVTAEAWPRFTMIGQSIGSALLATEALWKSCPHVFVDTTGYAFSYPIARFLFGATVHCYTHYPTISNDMLQLVYERRPMYNNEGMVQRSLLLARIKWLYYRFFALLYSAAGRCAQLVFVNSSWTRRHIDSLFRVPERTHIVYPPCDTKTLQQIPLGRIRKWEEDAEGDGGDKSRGNKSKESEPMREDLILSVAQFRPEKDHPLQLRAFALFLQKLNETSKSDGSSSALAASHLKLASNIKLVLLGGVRDAADERRVESLRSLARELHIEAHVEFVVNAEFNTLHSYLSRSTAALHTMWNEHFGIGVVEFMAAGVIPIAHCSGGPKSDIVVTEDGIETGFLASTAEEYAAALGRVFVSPTFRGSAAMQKMRQAARKRAAKFSDEAFIQTLQRLFVPMAQRCKQTVEVTQQNGMPLGSNAAESSESSSKKTR